MSKTLARTLSALAASLVSSFQRQLHRRGRHRWQGAALDASKRLEVPQIRSVQSSGTSQVSLRWRAVPGAEIYLAGLSLAGGATCYAQVIGFS